MEYMTNRHTVLDKILEVYPEEIPYSEEALMDLIKLLKDIDIYRIFFDHCHNLGQNSGINQLILATNEERSKKEGDLYFISLFSKKQLKSTNHYSNTNAPQELLEILKFIREEIKANNNK